MDGSTITTLPQKMWITFKYTYDDTIAIFQKTLKNGIEYNEEDNYYRFQFFSEDTNELPFGIYGFDIAIINEYGEKKTLLNNGKLNILSHYTKKDNEV
jgi:hypothetical protein